MSTPPLTPFNRVFAKLTQGMSAARGTRVTNEVGWQKDAQHTTDDRLVWIPRRLSPEQQHFELPGVTTPFRQASAFNVSIYGSSYDRLSGLHSLLVAWLDIVQGPPQGGTPSEDSTPAVLRGTVDLTTLVYPYSGLVGLTIKVAVPGARDVAFPSTPLAGPQDIANAINVVAQAFSGPDAYLRARIVKEGAARYLELLLPSDPLGTVGATLTIDPMAANSACAALGFSSGDSNITATGTPPTRPYAPGYLVGDSEEPGIRGENTAAQGWGVVVPVTLYRPIVSWEFPQGVIASTELQVSATGGDIPDEVVIDVTASAAA